MLLLVGLLLCSLPVWAQKFSDDAEWETFSNRYVSVSLGVKGWVQPYAPLDDYQTDIPGRWSAMTTEGDPDTPNDNNLPIINIGEICPCDAWGYFCVRIGEKNYLVGDPATGSWSRLPGTYPTPPPGLGLGRSGGFIYAEWTVREGTNPLALVAIRFGLIRDQIRLEFTITSLAATAQKVGFVLMGDTYVGSNDRMGYTYLPGTGYWRQASSVPKTMGTVMTGSKIPAEFEAMDTVDNPTVVARNTLKLQDCTPPDCLIVGEWQDLADYNLWPLSGYKPDLLIPIDDLSWHLSWNQISMGRGATRKIVTYFGMGSATTAWTYRVGRRTEMDSVALAVQGPKALKYDSTTTNQNDLDPFPFTIKAYVNNLATDPGPYTLEDVTVSLYLPQGLQLSTSTGVQSARQSVGRVPANSEAVPVSWLVEPTGEYSGELEYFVTARDVSGWQQIVSRKVMVPATKKNVFRSGYQLMSVPFTFNNMTVEHAMGLNAGSFGAKYYDPVTNRYLPVTQLQSGQAFWMYISSVPRGKVLPFQLATDAAIIGEDAGKQLREQYIQLKRGWNLVGNPFVYPVYWGQVLFANTSDPVLTTVTLDQAVTNGWLSKTVYSWIPDSGTYEHFSDNDRLLLPWRGYWVYARSAVTMVLRPPVPPGTDVTTQAGGY